MNVSMEVMYIQLTGTVIKDRYCVLEKIGEGGNGSVYLAMDMELGQKWAVKVILPSQKKEAFILMELNHPFLPKIIDYEETEDVCYLIMEYIEGNNLENLIREGCRMDGEFLWEVVVKMSEILAYLHRHKKGFIYGDFKPQNLLLTDKGDIFLVDFGSAGNSKKEWQSVCYGTYGYAAPEQFQGRMTAASDVYAFGKTVKRLLLIRKPGMKNWWKLQILLFRCCRKNDKKRYQNMEEVRKRLIKIQPVVSRNVNVMRPAVAFGIQIMLLLIMACIGGLHGSLEMNRQENLMKDVLTADFRKELTEVTDIYWNDESFQDSGNISRNSCKMAEQKLIAMLSQFEQKEEQIEILSQLAVNAEYRKDYKDAEFYYKQLLTYDDYAEGYGMYGCFLDRREKEEKSRELYEGYKKIEFEENDEDAWYYQNFWER